MKLNFTIKSLVIFCVMGISLLCFKDIFAASTKRKNIIYVFDVSGKTDFILKSKNSKVIVITWSSQEIRIEASIEVNAPNAKEAQLYLDKILFEVDSTGNSLSFISVQPFIRPVIREKSFMERIFGSSDLFIFISYQIWVPERFNIGIYSSKGSIEMENVNGRIHAETTLSAVNLKKIRGSVTAHTTNASLNVEIVELGADDLELTTTNADINIELPKNAKISYYASAEGGEIINDLKLYRIGPFTNQIQYGWINGKGVNLRLYTTNGKIIIKGS
ncbi:hypothetical protein IIB79_02250 [candidate division KSB1 bacterium]|nr:hypothetical protein [candidate division KSB1 bacterium]